MSRIRKFNQFELDSILESRLYFLTNLRRYIADIINDGETSSEIVKWLVQILKSESNEINSDTTFLSLEGDHFSFSREADIKKHSPESADYFFGDYTDDETRVSYYFNSRGEEAIEKLPNRGKIKIGKLIKKIVPEIPDNILEEIVNKIKSHRSGYEIKLVKGDEIINCYKTVNCDPELIRYGTLRHSCMMDKVDDKPHIFDIYTKNPESCQLAVMLNSNGDLVARALVWKISEVIRNEAFERNDAFYKEITGQDSFEGWNRETSFKPIKPKNLLVMDRIYYTKDWMEEYMIKWATQNGMMIRLSSDNFSYKSKICDPTLIVKVRKLGYRQFPYLDTFNKYDVQRGCLTNRYSGMSNSNRGFELSSTSGKYTTSSKKDTITNYIRRFKDYL